MKTILLFILYLFLSVGLTAQSLTTDKEDLNLKGKVKILRESFFDIQAGDNYYKETASLSHYNRKVEFDHNGNKVREEWYIDNFGVSPNEEYVYLHSFWTFHYNPKGLIATCNWFNCDSTLISRWTYSYDKQGRKIACEHYDGLLDISVYHEYRRNFEGQIQSKSSKRSRDDFSMSGYCYHYDEKGNKIREEAGYISLENEEDEDGEPIENKSEHFYPDWEGIYKYDEKNRLIYENGDGEYDTYTEYQYDEKDRISLIKKGIFDSLDYSLTTYSYDHQGNILKVNVDIIQDDNFGEWEDYYRQSTGIKTKETTTYCYSYNFEEGNWNWTRREETKNGKKLLTYREIEYYEK